MSKSALDSLKSVFNVFKRKPSLRAPERTGVYREIERVERGNRFLGFKLPPPTPHHLLFWRETGGRVEFENIFKQGVWHKIFVSVKNLKVHLGDGRLNRGHRFINFWQLKPDCVCVCVGGGESLLEEEQWWRTTRLSAFVSSKAEPPYFE